MLNLAFIGPTWQVSTVRLTARSRHRRPIVLTAPQNQWKLHKSVQPGSNTHGESPVKPSQCLAVKVSLWRAVGVGRGSCSETFPLVRLSSASIFSNTLRKFVTERLLQCKVIPSRLIHSKKREWNPRWKELIPISRWRSNSWWACLFFHLIDHDMLIINTENKSAVLSVFLGVAVRVSDGSTAPCRVLYGASRRRVIRCKWAPLLLFFPSLHHHHKSAQGPSQRKGRGVGGAHNFSKPAPLLSFSQRDGPNG